LRNITKKLIQRIDFYKMLKTYNNKVTKVIKTYNKQILKKVNLPYI